MRKKTGKMMTGNSFKLYLLCIIVNLCIKFHHASIPEDCPNYGDYPKKDEWYPKYHLAPPSGWMNDPNGLIAFGGYYHAFYQHDPYHTYPVPEFVAWGHARSKDMLKWESLPIAISPNDEFDKGGCFSGSAVDDNGTMTLLYTGRSIDEKNVEHQVQCIATSSDTVNFTKGGKVLDSPNNNPNFRDPKVWRVNKSWFMVVGLRNGNTGQVLLYKSPDLRNWKFQRVLITANKKQGYMFECPDFYNLKDKYILMVSPQGIKPKGYKYRNLYQSGYFVGNWQPDGNFRVEQDFREVDFGHDFYAPQSFLAPDGRRIMIGWLDMWNASIAEDKQGWAGMLTLPRELTLSPDKSTLVVQPIREVETLRSYQTIIEKQVLKDEYLQIDNHVTTMEIITTWNITESDAEKYGLRLGDRGCTDDGVYLYYDDQIQSVVLDRHYKQYNISGYRSFPLENIELLTLRVFFDQSSMEVFINNGLACMSSRIYPSKEQRFLSLFAENGAATLTESTRWLLSVP